MKPSSTKVGDTKSQNPKSKNKNKENQEKEKGDQSHKNTKDHKENPEDQKVNLKDQKESVKDQKENVKDKKDRREKGQSVKEVKDQKELSDEKDQKETTENNKGSKNKKKRTSSVSNPGSRQNSVAAVRAPFDGPLKDIQATLDAKIKSLEKRQKKLRGSAKYLEKNEETAYVKPKRVQTISVSSQKSSNHGDDNYEQNDGEEENYDEKLYQFLKEQIQLLNEIKLTVDDSIKSVNKLKEGYLKQYQLDTMRRYRNDVARLKWVLTMQDLLRHLDGPTRKQLLEAGPDGKEAILNHEQLDQIDSCKEFICPSCIEYEVGFKVQLDKSINFIMQLYDEKKREAFRGINFRDLKELLDRVSESPFFIGRKPSITPAVNGSALTDEKNNEQDKIVENATDVSVIDVNDQSSGKVTKSPKSMNVSEITTENLTNKNVSDNDNNTISQESATILGIADVAGVQGNLDTSKDLDDDSKDDLIVTTEQPLPENSTSSTHTNAVSKHATGAHSRSRDHHHHSHHHGQHYQHHDGQNNNYRGQNNKRSGDSHLHSRRGGGDRNRGSYHGGGERRLANRQYNNNRTQDQRQQQQLGQQQNDNLNVAQIQVASSEILSVGSGGPSIQQQQQQRQMMQQGGPQQQLKNNQQFQMPYHQQNPAMTMHHRMNPTTADLGFDPAVIAASAGGVGDGQVAQNAIHDYVRMPIIAGGDDQQQQQNGQHHQQQIMMQGLHHHPAAAIPYGPAIGIPPQYMMGPPDVHLQAEMRIVQQQFQMHHMQDQQSLHVQQQPRQQQQQPSQQKQASYARLMQQGGGPQQQRRQPNHQPQTQQQQPQQQR